MIFTGCEYMTEDNGLPADEAMHAYLMREIVLYIDKVKSKSRETPIIEIIMDYTFKNELDIETVGDVIGSDEYFKSFLEKDCELHRSSVQKNDW